MLAEEIESYEYSNKEINYSLIRFLKYIEKNKIKIESFWTEQQVYVTVNEFKNLMKDIDFPEAEKHFRNICNELMDQQQRIYLDRICNRIPYWHKSEEMMVKHLKQKALRLVQNTSRTRPQSGFKYQNRPISGISRVSKYSAYSDLKSLDKINQEETTQSKIIENKSNHYLSIYNKKQKELDKKLLLTIRKGQFEEAQQTYQKIAEANEMLLEMKSSLKYQAVKYDVQQCIQLQNLRVLGYEDNLLNKNMSEHEFSREFSFLKLRHQKEKDLQQIQQQQEDKKPNFDDFGDQQSKNLIQDQKIDIKKQQLLDVKQALCEIMILNNVFKQQIQVLNKKGINAQSTISHH